MSRSMRKKVFLMVDSCVKNVFLSFIETEIE